MTTCRLVFSILVLAVLGGCATGIEGTYLLESRVLPDGSMQRAPAIRGCLTFGDGLRNFNVHWEEPDGSTVSIASIARYELTGGAYRETNVYHMMKGPDGVVTYDLEPVAGVSPVTRNAGTIEFDFPLHDEPSAVFDAAGLSATSAGAFIDRWRRVD